MTEPFDCGNSVDPDRWLRNCSDEYKFAHDGAGVNGRALVDNLVYVKGQLPLFWFHEIKPMLDVKDFVQGVLIEGSGAVVYGESNAGKTFWTTDLALHVAAGKEWNGRRIQQGGVVYCVLEGGAGFCNRVSAWRDAHEVLDANFPFAVIPAALNLLDPEADTPRLITAIKQAAMVCSVPVKLVVIDTLSRAMAGGNENAPDDMGALVRNMDKIRQECRVCVLFVHHSGKDAARGARGHSLLRAAIDTEIEVRADDATGQKSALVAKQRELKKGDVFGFTLDVVKLGENRYGEDVTTCIVANGKGGTPAHWDKKLNKEAASLWLEIERIFMAEHGRIPSQRRVGSEAPKISRAILWTELVRSGWLQVSGSECKLKDERVRLWKRLNALKHKGFIDFDRTFLCVLQEVQFPEVSAQRSGR
jgi:hypothetical protein